MKICVFCFHRCSDDLDAISDFDIDKLNRKIHLTIIWRNTVSNPSDLLPGQSAWLLVCLQCPNGRSAIWWRHGHFLCLPTYREGDQPNYWVHWDYGLPILRGKYRLGQPSLWVLPLLADHTKEGLLLSTSPFQWFTFEKGIERVTQPMIWFSIISNVQLQHSRPEIGIRKFGGSHYRCSGRQGRHCTDRYKPSMLLTDIYNSLLLYRTSGETSGDRQESTRLSFDSIPNMGLCRLCRLEKSDMGRMGRIHDLSYSLRSHDEAHERRNGVLNQRGCPGLWGHFRRLCFSLKVQVFNEEILQKC